MLVILKLSMEQHAAEMRALYPNAAPTPVTFVIHSNVTFEVLQICAGNVVLISLSARKTQFEFAFRDYGDLRHS
jgi:hypothetical protein